MSFPRYPSYKDSGVEWLGEVPEHWTVTKLRRIVNPGRQITYGIVQAGPHIADGIPYIRPTDMTDEQGVLVADELMRTSPEIAGCYTRSTIRSGDLVCSIGPSFGKLMITPDWLDGANLTQGTARIAVQEPNNARYVFWTLRSPASFGQWERSVGGATFRALNLGPLAETTTLVPDGSEQTQIAAFLDRETAKIDELVAEQRRLMELLKEKRQAVISDAVMKGLNPDAPMKPSGIEWLGEVPAHWELNRIANVFREVGEPGTAELPILSVSIHHGVSDKEIDEDELERKVTRSDDRSKYKQVSPGDLVYNMMRAWQGGFGTVTVMGMVSPAYVVARPLKMVKTAYIEHLLRTPQAIEQMRRHSRGVTDFRLRLYWDEFKNIRVALPPIEEATAICAKISELEERFSAMSAESAESIRLLQERRTALISAAVTGQIDVRALSPTKAMEATT
jgi:type I restriction enzyme S subunit